MAVQLQLLDKPETIASPLCMYEHCTRRGRCELGPPEVFDGCINRTLRCLTCGCTGEQSTNTERD